MFADVKNYLMNINLAITSCGWNNVAHCGFYSVYSATASLATLSSVRCDHFVFGADSI